MEVKIPEDLKDKPAEALAYVRGYLAAKPEARPEPMPVWMPYTPQYIPMWDRFYFDPRPYNPFYYSTTTSGPEFVLTGVEQVPL